MCVFVIPLVGTCNRHHDVLLMVMKIVIVTTIPLNPEQARTRASKSEPAISTSPRMRGSENHGHDKNHLRLLIFILKTPKYGASKPGFAWQLKQPGLQCECRGGVSERRHSCREVVCLLLFSFWGKNKLGEFLRNGRKV